MWNMYVKCRCICLYVWGCMCAPTVHTGEVVENRDSTDGCCSVLFVVSSHTVIYT